MYIFCVSLTLFVIIMQVELPGTLDLDEANFQTATELLMHFHSKCC
jgi:hypothetical protein